MGTTTAQDAIQRAAEIWCGIGLRYGLAGGFVLGVALSLAGYCLLRP